MLRRELIFSDQCATHCKQNNNCQGSQHKRQENRHQTVLFLFLDADAHYEHGRKADYAAEYVMREAAYRLDEINRAEQALDRIAESEYNCAEHVLLFAVERYKSAGQGQNNHRQPGAEIYNGLIHSEFAEQHLNCVNHRLAYEEKHKALEHCLPVLAAVDDDYNRKDNPPFVAYADVLE